MFKASHGSSSLDMSFSSTLQNIDQADQETKSFLSRIGLQAKTFGIRLVMREGLLNSVKHGNSADPHKIVTCNLRLEDNRLVTEIEDEGPGFDWRAHTGKQAPLTSHSGRGLTIMKMYCDHVGYSTKGNRLILTKNIGEKKVPTTEITKSKVPTTEITRRGGQTIVKPGKDLVASIAPEFKKLLLSLLEEGTRELAIDLTGVEMVDTDGLRLLAEVHDCLRKAGGKLIVTNATEDIYGLFKAIQLDQHVVVVTQLMIDASPGETDSR